MDPEMTFLAMTTAVTTLWLLFLWGVLAFALRLVAAEFPSVERWRSRLLKVLSWAWRLPLGLTLVFIALGLWGGES